MSVRIFGPGSPLERYKGKLIAADGQPETIRPTPVSSPNSYTFTKIVDAGALAALSMSYSAAEAAIVRLGREDRRSARGEGQETLSFGVVSRLLAVDEVHVDSNNAEAEEAVGFSVANAGEPVKGEDGASVVANVANKVSKDIRKSREQALWSHK